MNKLGLEKVPFLFIINFEGNSGMVIPKEEAASKGVYYQILHHKNHSFTAKSSLRFSFSRCPVDFQDYQRSFHKVLRHIQYGNSYLVNLTFPTPIRTDLSLTDLFTHSNAPFKLLIDNDFVVFSPEPFVFIENGMISSFPMKGTIDAHVSHAEDKILNNLKEKAEHFTIVDLIRNDLSKVATEVKVLKFRYIEKINTNYKSLLQVSSHIRGTLPVDYKAHIGDIMKSLLPAGSVSGAPKKKTLEIIREAEPGPRGFFTGVFGLFDGHQLWSAVMIRYIEQTKEGKNFRSGGGITAMSDCKEEYQEMIDKVYVPIV